MIYFIIRDEVNNELTPIFNQNTEAGAARVLKEDGRILERINHFSISKVAKTGYDKNGQISFAPVNPAFMPVKDFIDNYDFDKKKGS